MEIDCSDCESEADEAETMLSIDDSERNLCAQSAFSLGLSPRRIAEAILSG